MEVKMKQFDKENFRWRFNQDVGLTLKEIESYDSN